MDPIARFLKATTTALQKHSDTIQNTFGELSPEQLNWQPNPKTWSVGVILDHLIVTNKSYFPTLKSIGDGSYKMSFWCRVSPFSQVLGRTMVKNLGPNPKRAYSSPPAFQPTASKAPADILDQFQASQKELLALLPSLEGKELNKIRIPSPASSFLTYSAWHALRIIDVHEARHIQQAKRLVEMPEFIQLLT